MWVVAWEVFAGGWGEIGVDLRLDVLLVGRVVDGEAVVGALQVLDAHF